MKKLFEESLWDVCSILKKQKFFFEKKNIKTRAGLTSQVGGVVFAPSDSRNHSKQPIGRSKSLHTICCGGGPLLKRDPMVQIIPLQDLTVRTDAGTIKLLQVLLHNLMAENDNQMRSNGQNSC